MPRGSSTGSPHRTQKRPARAVSRTTLRPSGRDDGALLDSRHGEELRFDFARLDPKAGNLQLTVDAPEIVERHRVHHPHQVARAVAQFARP